MAAGPLHLPSRATVPQWRSATAAGATALAFLTSVVCAAPAVADDVPVAPASVVTPAAVTISGTVAVGQTVSAVPGVWDPAETTFTYEWAVDSDADATFEPVAGAGDQAFTITPDLVGLPLQVTVTGTAPDTSTATVSSDPAVVAEGSFTSAPTPTVSGVARVGTELLANAGTWAPTADVAFQWLAGGVVIPDATDDSYTPTAAELGKQLSVQATASAPGYAETLKTSASTAAVGAGSFTSAPTPTVSGVARVGTALLATPGTWTPTATVGFQWFAGGVVIPGATANSYTPAAADLGKRLSVQTTGTAPGYVTTTKTSAPTAVVTAGTMTAAPNPTLTGAVRVGGIVTAVPGAWPVGTTFTYQWRRNNVAIRGATTSVYRPGVGDRTYRLSVSVTGRLAGYTTVTRTSAPATVAPGVFTTAPTPTIAGTVRVGYVLTARPGTWGPAGTLAYRWLRNGVLIPGATGVGYRLTSADLGRQITVRVYASRSGWTSASRTSLPTPVVVTTFAATYGPTISGTARVGSVLTASVHAWSPAATFLYAWRRDGVPIPGATARTYRLTSDDYNHVVTVTVYGQRTAYVQAAYTSKGTPRIAADGTYKVGSEIAPGIYRTGSTADCLWARLSNLTDGGMIALDIGDGQRIVEIKASDAYFYTDGCGAWTRLTALSSPGTTIRNGVFAVGGDIVPGTYQTAGGADCYWGRLSGFGAEPDDITDAYIGDEPQIVQILPTDVGFESSDCGTWTRTGD
jgi:hypothetical protein